MSCSLKPYYFVMRNFNYFLKLIRYKEHEVEQDEPVCEMVIERKCNGVAGKNIRYQILTIHTDV